MRAAGEQPRDLAAVVGVEHPGQARGAPVAAVATSASCPDSSADGAGLVAVDPAEAVVAEGELEERIRLRATDIGALVGGDELNDRDPPAGGGDEGETSDDGVPEPPEERQVGRDEVGQREAGHDEQHLESLGEEADAEEDTDEGKPPR